MPARLKKTDLSDTLCAQLTLVKIPYNREQRACLERRWRIDIVLTDYPIAIECEGGQWKMGRHNRPSGFEGDMEKYNAIALSGLTLLRFNHKHIKSGYALDTIEAMINKLNMDKE